MRFRPLVLASLLALSPAIPAFAEALASPAAGGTEIVSLSETMKIGPLLEVLRLEGQAYGTTLHVSMFPDDRGTGWARSVDAIYDVARLRRTFDTAISAELSADPAAVAEIVAFFGSERGQRIVTLELEARRTLLDIAAKEAAQVAADKMTAAHDPRIALITRLIEAGDLIEMNVAGALSGNLAFMRGMQQEGIYGDQMTEGQMLSDVWGQEEQIRADTLAWLYPYLALAYQPLQDADLQAYLAFSDTPAGKKLNAALFTAFDKVFQQVSYDLGRAAGRRILGHDI